MASYHNQAKTIGRVTGRSAVASAAYRSGEKMTDFRTGLAWDYTRRGGVARSEIVAPDDAPAWALDRQALWNAAEVREDKSTRRDTAKTAREFEVALPHELSREEREAAALTFARYLVDTYGVVADVSFHDPHKGQDARNFHAHIMTTTRSVGPDGFGAKIRELDSPRTSGPHLFAIKDKWAEIGSAALSGAGLELEASRFRHGHKTLAEQREAAFARGDVAYAEQLDREATIHLGPKAAAMEQRGEASELGDRNREIAARNEEREAMRAELAGVSAEIVDLAEERAKRAAEKEITASVRTHDPARVLDAITERRATFTRGDLNYHLSKQIADAKARSAFMDEVLGHGETVALRDAEGGPVTRYTTRDVLRAETALTDAGRGLAQQQAHGIRADRLADCLDRHAELDSEQRAAVAHCTEAGGLAIVAGEAGTGKSRTMGAIRDAYEADGARVIGLAWTNAVAQDMQGSGYREASTIAAELMRQKSGRGAWDDKTVLMIDEAAMLATRHLSEVMTRAVAAGAKVILVGDDKQLASIEHGGMFTALREEHGAAELHTVRRVQEADQRRAFNQMHGGDFRAALGAFEARGAIHWQQGEGAATAALVARYMADTAAEPDKARFAFAYTNAEVATINAAIRDERKRRGELEGETVLQTKDGSAAFAAGDRVQFTGSAYGRAAKAGGLVNGMVGTVVELDGAEMTVRLDGTGKGGKAREVSFVVGDAAEAGEFNAIRHGYAGTIYKGQGRTLDQTYVLHSRQWRSATGYVAMTRHREDLALFVDRDEAKDIDRLARQMARVEEKRAASQFYHDELTPEQLRPPVTRRYGELDEAHRSTAAAERAAAAQRIAARIGKIGDPARQADALRKAHGRDDAAAAPDAFERFLAEARKNADPSPEAGRQRERGFRTR